jgi:hypothetical protein
MSDTHSKNGDGEQYLLRLIAEQEQGDAINDNCDSDIEDGFDDEDSCFTTVTVEGCEADDDSIHSNDRTACKHTSASTIQGSENGPSTDSPPSGIDITKEEEENGTAAPPAAATSETEPSIPRGRSICHFKIMEKKLVFVSLDLETGGENCGIVQLSAEIARIELDQNEGNVRKDTLSNVVRDGTVFNEQTNSGGMAFNEYVNPGEDAEWAAAATATHGLSAMDERITSARDIGEVWISFCSWIEKNIAADEEGVIIAYNGAGCDMKWIWRLTQAPNALHAMPARLAYFMDPLKMIKKWKSCKIHPLRSKLESLSLGSVWSYTNGGKSMEGAHDSLVDASAQMDIVLHKSFVPFINRTEAFAPIENIFGANQLRELKRELEPIRPVHQPWQELTADSTFEWAPGIQDSYTGSQGGGDFGPTAAIKEAARTATELSVLFFFMVPLAFFHHVSVSSDKYCYKDWVIEKIGKDRDGNRKKRRYFEDVWNDQDPEVGDRRHRGDKEKKKFAITPGFVICWVAHLIMQGALFGANKPATSRLYRKSPHGINVPILRNVMTRDAFTFMRRFVHFCDNQTRKRKGMHGYDPLCKVSYALDEMMKGMHRAWVAGKHVTIDESMIKYMGRAVSFVQYMPAKPIKHGIKLFCLCCAYTGVMLAFNIYLGKSEEETKTTALIVCERLCNKAGLLKTRGRVLFTDNYYTSIKLSKHMFEQYGWTTVGTIVPTDKKHRENDDFPFLKLSNGARSSIERGWFREAVIKILSPRGTVYYIQATTWRDKKQVCFLSNSEIGFSDGFLVRRHRREKKERDIIVGVRAQSEYVKCYNAVDRNDRDSADYSTSIRTNRYYLRIFCWGLDRVIHCEYQIVCWLVVKGVGNSK